MSKVETMKKSSHVDEYANENARQVKMTKQAHEKTKIEKHLVMTQLNNEMREIHDKGLIEKNATRKYLFDDCGMINN